MRRDIHVLPPQGLPETWADALRWARTREGYRSALSEKMTPKAREAIAQRICDEAGLKINKLDSAHERLDKYLDGDADLPLGVVAFMIQVTGGKPTVGPIAPIEVFRSSWLDVPKQPSKEATRPPTKIEMDVGNLIISQLQPLTFDRVINGSMRQWQESCHLQGHSDDGELPELFVSKGAGVLVVLRGRVRMIQLGVNGDDVKDLAAGDLVFYRQSWPHVFLPLDKDARTLDLCASKRSIPPEYQLRPYDSSFRERPFEKVIQSPPTHRSVPRILSHLVCCLSNEELERLDHVSFAGTRSDLQSSKRIAILKNGHHDKENKDATSSSIRLDLYPLLQIGHLLRVPEEHFFVPFEDHFRTACSPRQSLLSEDWHAAKRFENCGHGFESAFVGRPPTEIYGRASELEVHLLRSLAPDGTTVEERRKEHSAGVLREVPGERLVFILRGKLGVSLFDGRPDHGFCKGYLSEGDSLWVRSDQLIHGFWDASEDNAQTLALDVRFPYGQGAELAWGIPSGRS